MGNLRELKYKIKAFRIKNDLITSFLSEFLGTLVLIAFGLGGTAQYVLGRGSVGDYLAMSFSWGMGAGMGIYVSFGATGGHINPCVSFTMMVLGRLTPLRFLVYIFAQYLGAIAGAACVYGVYHDAIDVFDGGIRQLTGPNQTMSIFVTVPQNYLSTTAIFADVVFASTMFLLVLVGMTDKKNVHLDSGLLSISVFLLISVQSLSFGMNTGNPINPARDLGPRIFCSLAGWGVAIFEYQDYYFWIPLVAPHVGAACGGLMYLIFIERHLPDQRNQEFEMEKLKQLETISISINPS